MGKLGNLGTCMRPGEHASFVLLHLQPIRGTCDQMVQNNKKQSSSSSSLTNFGFTITVEERREKEKKELDQLISKFFYSSDISFSSIMILAKRKCELNKLEFISIDLRIDTSASCDSPN